MNLQVERLQFLILTREVQKCPLNISNSTKYQFAYANYLCIMEMISYHFDHLESQRRVPVIEPL